jgi:hypothetical protein
MGGARHGNLAPQLFRFIFHFTPHHNPVTINFTVEKMGRPKKTTHEQNLARVRKNQQNHRARVREYIADLERRLKDTQALLEIAENNVEELTAQLDAHRRNGRECHLKASTRPINEFYPGSQEREATTMSRDPITFTKTTLDLSPKYTDCPLLPLAGNNTNLPIPSADPSCGTPSNQALSSPMYTETTALVLTQALQLREPRGDESTTLCKTAYDLIEQQNFRRLDVTAVYQWLWRGFRCGLRDKVGEADECRVENGVLFELLDYVSSA